MAVCKPVLPGREAEPFAGRLAPAVRLAGAPALVRAANKAAGRVIAVLDDDPTGSQAVHDVDMVTSFSAGALRASLGEAGSTCFIWTNTRSLGEAEAGALCQRVGRTALALGQRSGLEVRLVSRSDSTLRGHLVAEVRALDRANRQILGRGFDGFLLAPAFFEAGRVTAGDVHWARTGGQWAPVGETEFARDAAFGYVSSNLKELVAEKSGGTISPADVRSITLDDIRLGGPERVAQVLANVRDGAFVVVNALSYDDFDVVVLAIDAAEKGGQRFLYRTGPSFVRALAGLEPRGPLTSGDIWPAGRPNGHGLVVVGSHVGLTNRQLALAQERCGLVEHEVRASDVLGAARSSQVAQLAQRVSRDLERSDVVLSTSREVLLGNDPADSLRISREVSAALAEVVRGALGARPAWVVAKGGITSHDVAVHGLGLRRARAMGQVWPGMVSVVRVVDARAAAVGLPYVVFPGNVGDEAGLAQVIELLRGSADAG